MFQNPFFVLHLRRAQQRNTIEGIFKPTGFNFWNKELCIDSKVAANLLQSLEQRLYTCTYFSFGDVNTIFWFLTGLGSTASREQLWRSSCCFLKTLWVSDVFCAHTQPRTRFQYQTTRNNFFVTISPVFKSFVQKRKSTQKLPENIIPTCVDVLVPSVLSDVQRHAWLKNPADTPLCVKISKVVVFVAPVLTGCVQPSVKNEPALMCKIKNAVLRNEKD